MEAPGRNETAVTSNEDPLARFGPILLSSTPLPVAVRKATATDREAIVRFASTTPSGPDYIPDAFLPWLGEAQSVALVATVAQRTIGTDGAPLEVGTPVAFARIAIQSADEAWLDCIRVAPEVRERGVGTLLQVAELVWCRALGARNVRYVTAESNALSHRLGNGHGFRPIGNLRSYGRFELEDGTDSVRDPAPDLELRIDSRARTESLWARLSRDETFLRNSGLYEWRSWALQRLTAERFAGHAAGGDVVVSPDENAVASELDDHLALIVGDGGSAVRLLVAIDKMIGRRPRLRLPDPSPPILAGDAEEGWRSAGYLPHVASLHILEKRLVGSTSVPEIPADLLLLVDHPPAAED
jgi:GNAT superfamily N-acetyltransferase